MIVVPVPQHSHWCMSTIDRRQKTIHYYDSMGSPNNAVLNALEYMCVESMDKRKKPFDKIGLTKQNMRDCPHQENRYRMYVLYDDDDDDPPEIPTMA
uniref:Ubiquitin-like protease family profile domain-containing protein n=1 Tax=Anopheles minimus TaxID=112268 RepID=A0A182W8V9_9DIPT